MRRTVRRPSATTALALGAGLAALFALGACGEPTRPSEPSAPDPSAAAAEDLALLGAPSAVATPSLDQSPTSVPTCAYDAVTGRHICGPSRTPDGMAFSRSWGYRDAEGRAQERFDPALTGSVIVETELAGTAPGSYQGTTYVRTVNARTSFTTSGLAGNETARRVDGVRGATVLLEVTGGAPARLESRVLADTVSGLVFPIGGEARWPMAGRTVRGWRNTVTADGSETKVYFFREVVTYDGTNVAVVEISTDHGAWRCERDLAARTSRCTHS